MAQRRPARPPSNARVARARNFPRRAPGPAPAKADTSEVAAQVRAPNRTDCPAPLNEEELAALKVGWGFVE